MKGKKIILVSVLLGMTVIVFAKTPLNTARIYSTKYDIVFNAVQTMLQGFGYKIEKSDISTGLISTEQRIPNKDVIDSVSARIDKSDSNITVTLNYIYITQKSSIKIDDKQVQSVYDQMFEKIEQKISKSGKDISYPYNVVWGALLQTFAEKGIVTNIIDKESGVLSSKDIVFEDNLSFSSKDNFVADDEIKRISERPSVFMAVWKAGRFKYNILLRQIDQQSCNIRITCDVEAFNNIDGWRKCKSKGILEQELLDSIFDKI
ncbi:MAG: hypothetical protein ABII64_01145 [Elusimicrobiota bacterium]